ncbi:glycosyl hydrolase [Pochonia chlamydosporia 170]|uniref:Glycosyl hydrolase n=1 Tax=Pochonia chlamydosporia 170 TaxID=1380566 RepID=A0A179F2B0_METCM|nr:glycosyl hydrolase [Pochonia chlamydosporia 170]OAQ59574.1 glycosyl hydrolase [Pochonia chlamydosporia 170]
MRLIRHILASLCIIGVASAATSSSEVPKITKKSVENDKNYKAPYFPLLGFQEYKGNPILSPNPDNNWESAYLYNPSAIVIDDKVWLLYRAQNKSKTSVIGLAWSDDGYHFTRHDKPIMTPTEWYEKPGGCEDPRVVRVNGTFYMTYTGYDGQTARLCIATSTDLVTWAKHGPILPNITDVVYMAGNPQATYVARRQWSKSGAIINEPINGTYYMQFGDTYLYTANSTDLIHWNYEPFPEPFAQRLNIWEQSLMESAAPPIKTRDGKWLKIYNGVGTGLGGFKFGQYSTGEMLMDPVNRPNGPPIARLEVPLLQPTSVHEIDGQVDNVIFSEGLVQFHGKWFMYFGQGDEYLGVATTDVQP